MFSFDWVFAVCFSNCFCHTKSQTLTSSTCTSLIRRQTYLQHQQNCGDPARTIVTFEIKTKCKMDVDIEEGKSSDMRSLPSFTPSAMPPIHRDWAQTMVTRPKNRSFSFKHKKKSLSYLFLPIFLPIATDFFNGLIFDGVAKKNGNFVVNYDVRCDKVNQLQLNASF